MSEKRLSRPVVIGQMCFAEERAPYVEVMCTCSTSRFLLSMGLPSALRCADAPWACPKMSTPVAVIREYTDPRSAERLGCSQIVNLPAIKD